MLKWNNKYCNQLSAKLAFHIIFGFGIEFSQYDSVCHIEKIMEAHLDMIKEDFRKTLIKETLSEEESKLNNGKKYVLVDSQNILNFIARHGTPALILESINPKQNEDQKEDSKEEKSEEKKETNIKEEEKETIVNELNQKDIQPKDTSIDLINADLRSHATLDFGSNSFENAKDDDEIIDPFKNSPSLKWQTFNVHYLLRSFEKTMKNGSRDDLMLFLTFVYRCLKYLSATELNLRNTHKKTIVLSFILALLKSETLRKLEDLHVMMYSYEVTKTIFDIITDQQDCDINTVERKYIAYEVLIELLNIDIDQAKEAFRKW